MVSIIKMDETEPATDYGAELPEMVPTYDADVERPPAFEEASSTFLAAGTWSLVEGQVSTAAAADL